MKPNLNKEDAISLNKKLIDFLKSKKELYTSEKITLYRYYSSDTDRCFAESNFEAAKDSLGGQKAIDNNWLDVSDGEISVHRSQPFLILHLLKLEHYIEHDYPLLDEGDAMERESNCREENFECYKDDFIKELKSYAKKLKLKISNYSKKDFEVLASYIHEYDAGYCGIDDAWVNDESIERFFEQEYLSDYPKNKLITHIRAKVGAK